MKAFFAALGEILGSGIESVQSLGPTATRIDLLDGRRLVLKGVPRQETGWSPGRPWAELVAIDALSAAGAPVPGLVAADIDHGWLVEEFVEGITLDEVESDEGAQCFSQLIRGLSALQDASEAEWSVLSPHAAEDPGLVRAAGELARLLQPSARRAWEALGRIARSGEVRAGPLDVRGANVVVQPDGSVRFLDLATVGRDLPEKRLAAYTQRAYPKPRSLLTPTAYALYRQEAGEAASLRLAFYDFLFWGIVLARLIAAGRSAQTSAGKAVRRAWPDFEAIGPAAAALWSRRRMDDPRVEEVSYGVAWDRYLP